MGWAGPAASMEMRNTHIILAGKPEGRKPLGILRRRREDNIKLVLRKIVFGPWIIFIWLKSWTGGRLL
jgi:hypothetical protein